MDLHANLRLKRLIVYLFLLLSSPCIIKGAASPFFLPAHLLGRMAGGKHRQNPATMIYK
jgi:hypothetical protein